MTVLDLEKLAINLAGFVAEGRWHEALATAVLIEKLVKQVRKRAEMMIEAAAGP